MRVTSRDIDVAGLMSAVAERLRASGRSRTQGEPPAAASAPPAVEARVDPVRFSLEALGAHADSARPLPPETHRGGISGVAVVAAKRWFRRLAQPLITESLERQRLFNGHALDAYARLAAEVERLRAEVAELQGERTRRAASAPRRRSLS